MQEVTRRPPRFKSVQWNGTETAHNEIVSLTAIPAVGPYDLEVPYPLYLLSGNEAFGIKGTPIYENDWVVLEGGRLNVYTDDDYNETFQLYIAP